MDSARQQKSQHNSDFAHSAVATTNPGERWWIGISFAFLGYTVGLFIGTVKYDPSGIAAVLPAVLTLGGGLFVLKSERVYRSAPVSIVLFAVFIIVGSQYGYEARKTVDTRIQIAYEKGRVAYEEARREAYEEARSEHLDQCSVTEFRINSQREKLGLPPLRSEIFCGFQPPLNFSTQRGEK